MTAPRDGNNPLGNKNKNKTKAGQKAQQQTLGLLKKRYVDLTPAELDQLEVLLGTFDLPLPMWGTQKVKRDGETYYDQVLSVIAEDVSKSPLSVLSERPFAEAWGIIARELPTPSMLPIFREMLERLAPESKNRQFFVMGDPGMGKSFMGGMIARIMSTDTPRIYDCGGKQMNSMLFEMVLDFGAGDGLADQIEKRMMEGRLSKASSSVLRELKDLVPKGFINELKEGQFEIDWDSLAKESAVGSAGKMEYVMNAFNKIATLEGFDKGGANMLGMNSQFGPMITDFIEGNFSVYDEYNKSKLGGDDQLQTVLQFINGEIDECMVENPLKGKDGVSGPTHFIFKREDVRAGWGILFTGNKGKDGLTTRAMNKSVYSRLGPRDLPEVSQADWAHRICQLMTGVPVTTWYLAYKDNADKDPEAFAEFLWDIRTAGLSKEAVAAIPNSQKVWLKNWQRVVDASNNLGGFFHGWRELLDVDLASVNDLDEEVDAEFAAEQALDFRRVIKILQKASRPRAEMMPSSFKPKLPKKGFLKNKPKREKRLEADKAIDINQYGTRLTEILMGEIFESSGALGKRRLYEELKALAGKNALLHKDLKEAARSGVRTVEDLLNISRFDSADIRVQAKMAQEMFGNMLRERFPDITAEDQEIVTLERMIDIINSLREEAEQAREKNLLTVPNYCKESLMDQPFVEAKLYDNALNGITASDEDSPFYDDLLTQEEFLQAFVLPGLKEKNLNALWDNNLSFSTQVSQLDDELKKIASDMKDLEEKIREDQKERADKDAAYSDISNSETAEGKALKKEIDDLEKGIDSASKRLEKMQEKHAEFSALRKKVKSEGKGAIESISQAFNNSSNGVLANEVAMAIAENRHKDGLALTTVACRLEDNEIEEDGCYNPVHILHNAMMNKTYVIAHGVKDSLREAFEAAKVQIIDMEHEDAANKINAAASDLTLGNNSEELKKSLISSFMYRNNLDEFEKYEDLASCITSVGKVVLDSENKLLKSFYKPFNGNG